MMKIPSTLMSKLSLLIPLICLSASAFAESPAVKILYVGAISIKPSQDAKVLADWYAQLGIETKEYKGEYYAQDRHRRRDGGLRHPSQEGGCAEEIVRERFRRISG